MDFNPIWTNLRSGGTEATAPHPIDEHPIYIRMLRELPPRVRESLTPVQLAALAKATKPPPPAHLVDFRTSVPWFGGRFYVVFLLGRERRSRERLLREAQISSRKALVVYALSLALLGIATAALVVIGLYMAKSALGIDIFAGHSFLHDLVY